MKWCKCCLTPMAIACNPQGIWQKLFDAKRFGVKTGSGFYNYQGDDDGALEKFVGEVQKETGKTDPKGFSVERLLYPMINEAALCLQEHVSTAAEIDIAVLAGLGFPQDKEGLLHYADREGVDQSACLS